MFPRAEALSDLLKWKEKEVPAPPLANGSWDPLKLQSVEELGSHGRAKTGADERA